MVRYSFQEINDSLANEINALVQNGYKIESDKYFSGKARRFKVVLKKDFPVAMSITIRAVTFTDKIIKHVTVRCDELPILNRKYSNIYYWLRDNIYATADVNEV